MGKKDFIAQDDTQKRVQSVLDLLKKQLQAPLSLKQEKFCSNGCVKRFLKAEGENVKKAAKHLRNCLSWRDSFGTDHLMADEFSAELTEGMAYVAGHDDELRPVVIFRIKQDYQKLHPQKQCTRLLVFTLEVAIQTMAKNIEQFVLLLDASFVRSASSFMNMLVATLKIIADYYPLRLHKAFVIDPPALFSYLWKGVRPFVELSPLTVIISSADFEESSVRFDDIRATSSGSCSSSRFTFTVSPQFDSLKPWYLSLKDTSGSTLGRANLGPKISPLNGRSFSFGSAAPHRNTKKGFFPSTPMPQKPSFLPSPALFFRSNRAERMHESFLPFFRFYQQPYDEMIYRSKMRPPLGGLISIVSPQLIKRRHMSISQRF